MTTLRKQIQKQKRLEGLNSFLLKVLLILFVLLLASHIITIIFDYMHTFTILLWLCVYGVLIAMDLVKKQLNSLKSDTEIQIESILYLAIRKAISDDVFDDEIFGMFKCVKVTNTNILITLDIFNSSIDISELLVDIQPTVNIMQRRLKKRIDIFYKYN